MFVIRRTYHNPNSDEISVGSAATAYDDGIPVKDLLRCNNCNTAMACTNCFCPLDFNWVKVFTDVGQDPLLVSGVWLLPCGHPVDLHCVATILRPIPQPSFVLRRSRIAQRLTGRVRALIRRPVIANTYRCEAVMCHTTYRTFRLPSGAWTFDNVPGGGCGLTPWGSGRATLAELELSGFDFGIVRNNVADWSSSGVECNEIDGPDAILQEY